jgi:hypothetical protein
MGYLPLGGKWKRTEALTSAVSACVGAAAIVRATLPQYEELKMSVHLAIFSLLAQATSLHLSAGEEPSANLVAEAEACFLKAIEIARHQSAKSFELRAVMSLSRLWQQRDK